MAEVFQGDDRIRHRLRDEWIRETAATGAQDPGEDMVVLSGMRPHAKRQESGE